MSDKLNVGIINTGTSNLNSVQLACKKVGLTSQIIDEHNNLKEFGGLILPGVGAFDKVASELFEKGLDIKIKEFIETEKPLIGICLGFQLLFDFSEEFNGHRGLGILNGNVKKIPGKSNIIKGQKIRVPFIGWNRINKCNEEENSSWNKKPLSLIPDKTPMYFVHSYYVNAIGDYVTSTTSYENFTCCGSISFKNIFACQFHPEKSADFGLSIFDCLKVEIEKNSN
jgi:imidazole glycerol-phosphate synthase subunit HisH